MGDLGNFLFLAFAYILMDLFFTLYATPYLALGAELSREYHERTQIATTRAVFHSLGALLTVLCLSKVVGGSPVDLQEEATSLPTTFSPEAIRDGFAKIGALLGGAMILSGFIAFYGSREVPPPNNSEPISFVAFFRNLTSTLQSQPFRIIIFTFAVMTLGAAIHQPLTIYVFRDWLNMQAQLPTIMFLSVVSTIVSFVFWTRFARRVGKNRAFQVCVLWTIVVLSMVPFLQSDMPRQFFYLFIIFAGFGAGGYVLPLSIAADVIDYDELHSGQRREGAFFGLWTLTIKLVAAAAIAFVGVALDLIGYVPNQPHSATTLWGLKLLYGPIPALLFLVSLLIFLRFPLTRESHAEIQRQLQARRQA
jgi:GPH family glycoside/pentoside/hexuronide:cation symporter